MRMTPEAIVPFSLALSIALTTSFMGLWLLTVQWQLHRLITGTPREWFSPYNVARRRQRMNELLFPALVVFAATIACNISTTYIVEDQLTLYDFFGSRGFWWLFGGALLLFWALFIIVCIPEKSAWEISRNYESLLHVIKASNLGTMVVHRSALEQRFRELSSMKLDNRLVRASELIVVPAEYLSIRPKYLSATIAPQGSAAIRPTYKATWRWIWEQGRAALIVVAACSLLTAACGLWFVVTLGWPALFWGLLPAVLLVAGLFLLFASKRQELLWSARMRSEEQMFCENVRAELRIRPRLQIEEEPDASSEEFGYRLRLVGFLEWCIGRLREKPSPAAPEE